ncbi:MAG: Hsp20/alpha crystallin family protein [Bacteroidota bacterium]
MPEPRNLFSDLENVRQEMERLFRDFADTVGQGFAGRGFPSVDVYENNDQLTIRCDLPGMEQKEIEVLVERNSVTIAGELCREERLKKEDYHLAERASGRFRRVIALPKPINFDQARATFRNGVLTITAPVAEEAKRTQRSVPIESD